MKNFLFVICLSLLSIVASAQSKNHKLSITIGGGSQKYRGDLGNGFTFKNTCWFGTGTATIGYYVNKSFDAAIFGSLGDFGYHQPGNIGKEEVDEDQRCVGCIGRVGLGNLSSRMTSGGISMKYKFNNNYLLKENAALKPYIYVGIAVNKLVDRMKMNCVNAGNYFSLNAGAGVRYNITDRMSIGYNLGFGYFTSDKVDNMSHGSNDMYMQNTLNIGIDLF